MLNPIEFPRIAAEGYNKTSCKTDSYNCIAWAAGDESRWWWPMGNGPDGRAAHWPKGAPTNLTLKAFCIAFKTLGYDTCKDDCLEEGFEKVAIYAIGVKPTHAARQLADGNWTHKIGRNIDMVASLSAVEQGIYGEAVRYLRRKRRTK